MISVLTVALGVGAGTSLFSVVKAVLLNPLPYPQPDQLVWVAEVNESGGEVRVALPNFEDFRNQNRSFTALAAYGDGPVNAGGGEAPERTHGAVVTQDFFAVMGVQPAMGQTFEPADQKLHAPPKVVLSHALWQRAYAGDSRILGRKIRVVGMVATVVGIMPPGFNYPDGSEIWLPVGAFDEGGGRTAHNFRVVGRLRPGASVKQARAEISAIARHLKELYPGPFQARDAAVTLLQRRLVGEVRPALLVLFGAVGFLILIVCVNVANLLMVRISARTREISVRLALGAQRKHLFRQLLTESLVLALAGGALGLLAASWSMDLLRILLPSDVPRITEIRIDSGVIAFALAISGVTGILFGVLPAWRAARLNLNEALKAGSRSSTAGRRSHRTQALLVVSEVCLSLMLLAGSGLLLNSFWKLRSVDPGFRPDHVVIASTSFPVPAKGFDALVPIYRELLDQVRAIPGVESAAEVKDLPLDSVRRTGHFVIENRSPFPEAADAGYRIVSPGYLRTMRIPILRGRDLAESDTGQSTPVAVISAEMARTYWAGRDPLGSRVWFDSFAPTRQWLTVVGIAGDVRQNGLTEGVEAMAYVSYPQVQNKPDLLEGNVVLRTPLDPRSLAAAVRSRVRSVDPEAAVSFQTLDDVVAGSMARQRFQMQVLGGFAALALLLAAVGLYGVLSYLVTSTRAEIGVRMALGARPGEVFRMVTERALWLVSAGAALGLLGCLAVRSILATVLFGIGPSDPATLAAATATLLSVALAASWLPARRATRVDPVSALREE